MRYWNHLIAIIVLVTSSIAVGVMAMEPHAHDPANEHFESTWARADKPMADGLVNRTSTGRHMAAMAGRQ